jgi:hypothetical protein
VVEVVEQPEQIGPMVAVELVVIDHQYRENLPVGLALRKPLLTWNRVQTMPFQLEPVEATLLMESILLLQQSLLQAVVRVGQVLVVQTIQETVVLVVAPVAQVEIAALLEQGLAHKDLQVA